MKDFHSHLLMGIDDGSKNLETSIKILKKAQKEGITDIMLTSHYINNSPYMANNTRKKYLMNELKSKMHEENININLYLGNEVYIDGDIIDLIKSDAIATLNQTNYILVEFPLIMELYDQYDILKCLIKNGYNPIIAHPERYVTFQNNIEKLNDYLDLGVLLQGDYQSLFGKYGKKSKKILEYLLKNKLISFLGSDIHSSNEDYNIAKLTKILNKIIKDKQVVNDLMENNFDKVIEGKIV